MSWNEHKAVAGKTASLAIAASLLAASIAAAPHKPGRQRYEALRAGALRAVIQSSCPPGPVLLMRAGAVVGKGELIGRRGVRAELRALVDVPGRFWLRPAKATAPDRTVSRAPRFLGIEMRWVDGIVYPRFSLSRTVAGHVVRADCVLWGSDQVELRVALERCDRESGAGFAVSFELRAQALRLLERRGLRLQRRAASWRLVVPAERLRHGDALYVVACSATLAADPTTALRPDAALLKSMTIAPSARRALLVRPRAVQLRMATLWSEVSAARVRQGLARGDHVRRRDGERVVWTHGEFDFSLACLTVAARGLSAAGRRDAALALVDELLASADASCLHLLERNRRRSVPRVPVRHGSEHGFGSVDLGHVFLEGLLLRSYSAARWLEFDASMEIATELCEYVNGDPLVLHLRELVWPVRCLEAAFACSGRAAFARASDRLFARIAASSCARGLPDFAANRVPGARRVELWFVASFLGDALRMASARGSDVAQAFQRRLFAGLRGLPWKRIGLSPTLFVSEGAGSRGDLRGGGQEPCACALLVDGLAQLRIAEPRLRSWSKACLRALPGELWDPATRFALLARASWMRPAFSVDAWASGPSRARPSASKRKARD